MNVIEVMSFNDEETQLYYSRLDWWREEVGALMKKFSEGETKGKAEGETKGKAEEKFAIARNMLNKNMDTPLIAKITGLSEEKIIQIKQQL
jgi:predicted transposase/invertase (TIGR01784 family)